MDQKRCCYDMIGKMRLTCIGFRIGSFLSDIEKMHFLITKETVTWPLIEKMITCFNVLISDFFDSIVTFNGIVRRDTSFSLHYSTVFWLLGTFFNWNRPFGHFFELFWT